MGPTPLTLFLDDGGVMNENARRRPQWEVLVGEFFAPRLGGTPAAWAEANRVLIDGLFAPGAWDARMAAAAALDYAGFDRAYQLEWLGSMCAQVGVPVPPPDEAVALAHAATAHITRRVRAAYPGADEAVRRLHAAGYTLHTASGEPSYDLDGYLEGMGVRACFGRLYGPDLIDTFKNSPAYYARIFADAGIPPAQALVVDDAPAAVGWAAQVGAHTVLVGAAPLPEGSPTLRIALLADLPDLLARPDAPW